MERGGVDLAMELLYHLGLAVDCKLHLVHLLDCLLTAIILRNTLLQLSIMHIVAHLPIILILILMRKTVSTPTQPLIQISSRSCNLRVNLLPSKLLRRIDAQSRILHARIKLRHLLLRVCKIRNRIININRRLDKVNWFYRIWHLNWFLLLSCSEVVNV